MYAYCDNVSAGLVVTVWIFSRAGWFADTPSVRSRFWNPAVTQAAVSWNTIPVVVMSAWANITGSFGSPPSLSIGVSEEGPMYQFPAICVWYDPSARYVDVRFE